MCFCMCVRQNPKHSEVYFAFAAATASMQVPHTIPGRGVAAGGPAHSSAVVSAGGMGSGSAGAFGPWDIGKNPQMVPSKFYQCCSCKIYHFRCFLVRSWGGVLWGRIRAVGRAATDSAWRPRCKLILIKTYRLYQQLDWVWPILMICLRFFLVWHVC